MSTSPQESLTPGFVLAKQQHFFIGEQLRRVLKLIAARTAEDMEMQLEFLSAWG